MKVAESTISFWIKTRNYFFAVAPQRSNKAESRANIKCYSLLYFNHSSSSCCFLVYNEHNLTSTYTHFLCTHSYPNSPQSVTSPFHLTLTTMYILKSKYIISSRSTPRTKTRHIFTQK